MRLGTIIDKSADGAEIRKHIGRTGTRYFAWPLGATVAIPFVTLRAARTHLGITCAPKKAA